MYTCMHAYMHVCMYTQAHTGSKQVAAATGKPASIFISSGSSSCSCFWGLQRTGVLVIE